jgi:hypothetical protein
MADMQTPAGSAGSVDVASRSLLSLGLSLACLVGLRQVVTSDGAEPWRLPGPRVEDVLLVLVAWAGMGVAAWLCLGSALTLLSTAPGSLGRWSGRVACRMTPLLARRVLTVALGTSTASVALPAASVVGTTAAPTPVSAHLVNTPGLALGTSPEAVLLAFERGARSPGAAVGTGAGGPGYAPTDGPSGEPSDNAGSPSPSYAATGSRGPDASRDPGFRPTRPMLAHDPAASNLLAPPPRPAMATHDTVTVRRGDSLWSIAARHLGRGASDAEVARAWPHWHAANRAVIGEDPDLIRPGMQLVPPREGDLR